LAVFQKIFWPPDGPGHAGGPPKNKGAGPIWDPFPWAQKKMGQGPGGGPAGNNLQIQLFPFFRGQREGVPGRGGGGGGGEKPIFLVLSFSISFLRLLVFWIKVEEKIGGKKIGFCPAPRETTFFWGGCETKQKGEQKKGGGKEGKPRGGKRRQKHFFFFFFFLILWERIFGLGGRGGAPHPAFFLFLGAGGKKQQKKKKTRVFFFPNGGIGGLGGTDWAPAGGPGGAQEKWKKKKQQKKKKKNPGQMSSFSAPSGVVPFR